MPVSDRVCSYLIHFQSASFSGSVTIKGGVADGSLTGMAVAYKDMETGLNATAAITDSGLILVDASGIDITLDCTAYTSGSLTFTARPMIG
jgi:hypothetical protein